MLIGHSNKIITIRLSKNGLNAISTSYDKKLLVWDINNLKILKLIETGQHRPFTIDFL